jgi:hypothetical protein
LGGKVYDLYHSYKLAFEVNSAVAAMGIVALFFARMPDPPESSTPVRKTELALKGQEKSAGRLGFEPR